ncbi:uncharacterized protein L203_103103 [Cryptococcus depauperatus CBS 7841]|uniref:RING-CH-type domain-containing protein n=1 Tax=Cryptococcus depauperatus CBS 7841 TaxID=1295531 RepID=A0AAJ8JT00_9TREE
MINLSQDVQSPQTDQSDATVGLDSQETGEKQCRICLAGPEEEETLGRLISPCLCSGSMRVGLYDRVVTDDRYIMHQRLETDWYQQCTRIAGLAASQPVMVLSTLSLFSLLSLSVGTVFYLFLTRSSALSRTFLSPSVRVASPFDFYDDFMDRGGVVIVGGGGTLVWDILVAAVQTFVSFADGLKELQENLPGTVAVLLFGLGMRFLLGLAVLGSLSFVSLCISFSLFGPLQLANALRGGFFGSWGRRRLRLGGNGREGSIGTVLIVLLVAVGTINTLRQVYRGVGRMAERLLKFVETQILEVNPDQVKREMQDEWWVTRWMKDGRWKSVGGWKEFGYRMWVGIADIELEYAVDWDRTEAGFSPNESRGMKLDVSKRLYVGIHPDK